MTLQDIIMQLSGQAKPRPDLMPGGEKPYTYAGRVGTGPMKLSDMLARQPTESPDAEGMGSIAAMAAAGKVFKPGPSLAARLAKKGSQPVPEFDAYTEAMLEEILLKAR